jgi:hypothetical protein
VLEAVETSSMEQDAYEFVAAIIHAFLHSMRPYYLVSDFEKYITVFVGCVENFLKFVIYD